jgi:hypothetical protein
VSRLPRWRRLLGGEQLPDGFVGRLDAEERVLAVAEMVGGGHLVVTSYGVWLPDGRRIGWQLVSKATWSDGTLTVVEAEEFDSTGEVVLLRDLPPRRLRLAEPGGGAWFVQRSVPGRDGLLLQVRADPGTDLAAVRRVATEVAGKLRQVRD